MYLDQVVNKMKRVRAIWFSSLLLLNLILFIATSLYEYIGCSFKFLLKVGAEEWIVNAPLVGLQSKNTNNAKSEVRFKDP
jgi:hypothetical protein